MELIQYRQEQYDMEIIKRIVALENTAWPKNDGSETFPPAPNTYVTSFVWIDNDLAVCHVGIRKNILFHKGQQYQAFGLSEVVTHPCYQNQGLATTTIKKAAAFIIEQQADISIFTCEPRRVSFYTRGGWEPVNGACFVGGTKETPFRSDKLNLVTMMMFISPKAKLHRNDFEDSDIIFELDENQLW